MKITVSEIAEEGLDLEVEESVSSELVNIVSPVHASLRVNKETSEVMVSGEVDAEV